MSFFKQFPTTAYQFEPNQPTSVTDIFRHVDVNNELVSDINSYTYYEIEDGERPDNVSQKLYGTPDFYWTFFIVNETLKNGIDDWPKSYSSIEAELELEYDPLGSMVFVPRTVPGTEGNGFRKLGVGAGDLLGREYETSTQESVDTNDVGSQFNASTIQNNFSGLDLSYADLRIVRCLESAKIVNWNEKTLQLVMSDFTDRDNFFATDERELDRIRGANLIPIPDGGGITNAAPIQLNRTWLQRMYLSFNDWPIVGKDGNPANDYFPDILAGQQNNLNEAAKDKFGQDALFSTLTGEQVQQLVDADVLNQSFYTRKLLNTMTIERTEWMISVFKWLDTQFVDASKSWPLLPNDRGRPYMPYEAFLYYFSLEDNTIEQAALTVWVQYFHPYYRTGQLKFKGFYLHQKANGEDCKYTNFRNAPLYYYRNNDTEDVLNAYDVLGQSLIRAAGKPQGTAEEIVQGWNPPDIPVEGSDPDRFVSHYDHLIHEKDEKSKIRVIKPELIREFAQAYKDLIQQGSTVTGAVLGSSTAVAGSALGGGGGGAVSSGGGGGGGGSSSGGGGGGGY